jgi:hypothetical protein
VHQTISVYPSILSFTCQWPLAHTTEWIIHPPETSHGRILHSDASFSLERESIETMEDTVQSLIPVDVRVTKKDIIYLSSIPVIPSSPIRKHEPDNFI